MKLGTLLAVLAVSMWLALLCAIGHASVPTYAPNGFCRVTPRDETGIPDRSLVVCRWVGTDETGDGAPEIVEAVYLLNRKGGVDCARSYINILDPTKARHNLVRWSPAC